MEVHGGRKSTLWIFHTSTNSVQPSLCSPPSPQRGMHGNIQANALFPKYQKSISGNSNSYCGHRYYDDTSSGSKRSHVKKTISSLAQQERWSFNSLGDHPPGSRKGACTWSFAYSMYISMEGGIFKSSLQVLYIKNGHANEVQNNFVTRDMICKIRALFNECPNINTTPLQLCNNFKKTVATV